MKLKSLFLRLYWLSRAQFGIDPKVALHSLLGLPRYMRDFLRFRSDYAGRLELVPCLHDWHEEGGMTKSEYFWQDLLVSRKIFEARPDKHVDVGSRVDGFVAHVASFREIEVLDVRPISTNIPGVTFRQADLMYPLGDIDEGYCDSLSCLHALEHFGLGRYGDPVDVKGFERGLANMANMLRDGGVFYLSVPIGQDRIEFNAQRVFDPTVITKQCNINKLQLSELTVIKRGGIVMNVPLDESMINKLASDRYSLGIFTFIKSTHASNKVVCNVL